VSKRPLIEADTLINIGLSSPAPQNPKGKKKGKRKNLKPVQGVMTGAKSPMANTQTRQQKLWMQKVRRIKDRDDSQLLDVGMTTAQRNWVDQIKQINNMKAQQLNKTPDIGQPDKPDS